MKPREEDAALMLSVWPVAAHFIRADHVQRSFQHRTMPFINYQDFAQSTEFDYDSITIYNGFLGSAAKQDENGCWTAEEVAKFAMLRKDDPSKLILTGGAYFPENAKISKGDRARVAQLYPLYNTAGQKVSGELEGKPDWA